MNQNNASLFENRISILKCIEYADDMDKERAICQFMNEFGADVLRTAYFYLKDKSLADDIFQEVFIKLYKHIDTYRGEASVKTWILKITINQCKDYLKSSWFKRFLSGLAPDSFAEKAPDSVSSPEEVFIDKETDHELFHEVMGLSLPLRETLILYYYHNYSESEISAVLSIPQGTVRSRLHRAKTVLRTRLIRKGEQR